MFPERTYLYEGNGSEAKLCVQSLSQQYPVLDSVDARNFKFRIEIIATETISDDYSDVLEGDVIKGSHETIVNGTSSPLLLGIMCAASQYAAGSPVTTQNGPSRSMTSRRKLLRRCVCAEDVIRSFRALWSTKLNSSIVHAVVCYRSERPKTKKSYH